VRALPVPVLLGTTMFFWGAAFNVSDVAFDHTTPALVALSRPLIAAPILIALLPLFGARLPRDLRTWLWAAVAGAGATSLSLMGLSEGTSRAGPAVASVLLNTAPFWATFIAWAALRERPTVLRGAGLLVGFSGVLLIIFSNPGDVASGSDLYVGAALTIVGAVGYSIAGVAVRYMHTTGFQYELYGFTAAQFVTGALFLVPYALLSGDPSSTEWSSGELWAALIFLALGSQLVAFICFFRALERWTTARVLAWAFLPPVVAAAIEAVRGNLPGGLTAAGMIVVIAGVVIVNLPRAEVRERVP
jgi:drug/metabolite transporter (DMT)-like permease